MATVERYAYQVEILSPVHVGSGARLGAADLAVFENQLWRFDPERLAAALARDARMLNHYIQEGAAALRFWNEADRRSCARYIRPWPGPPPQEVREHIADPLGRPYLPGSSLKGAIRTALVFAALARMPESERRALMDRVTEHARSRPRARETAAEPVTKALLGPTPHADLLRALRISDSTPAPLEALTVGRVRVAVREPNGTLSWLKAPGQHVPDPAQAFAVDLEILRPLPAGSLRIQIELDRFILENPEALEGPRGRRELLAGWLRHCNEFARHLAKAEAAFGKQVGLAAYAAFYQRLLEEMEQDPQAIYLNIGWGTGWRSKTAAEAMGPEAVRRLRSLFGLGKGDPFPKTRRVLFEGKQPTLPLGWIRLRPLPR